MKPIAPAPAGAFRMAAQAAAADGSTVNGSAAVQLALGGDDGVVVDQHHVVDAAPHDLQRLRHRNARGDAVGHRLDASASRSGGRSRHE